MAADSSRSNGSGVCKEFLQQSVVGLWACKMDETTRCKCLLLVQTNFIAFANNADMYDVML